MNIENKKELVDKIAQYLSVDFLKTLESTDLDDDEKQANIVLSRKKIKTDAENIAELVFKAYGE